MKIFVDDYRPAPPGWTLAKTPSEALARVYQAAYGPDPAELISLDYCLETTDGPFTTFLPVAQLISALPNAFEPAVYIHSDHLDGSLEMFHLLQKAGFDVHLIDNIKMYAFYTGHQPESHALLPDPT